MRAITLPQTIFFCLLLTPILVGGAWTAHVVLEGLNLGEFRSIAICGGALIFIYLWAFAVYRLLLLVMPLPLGEVAVGSSGEFVAQLNTLFYLMLFYPITRTHFIPVPIMRLVYLALGAKMGSGSYSGGLIMDPPLTTIGKDSLIGHDAVLYAHVIEASRLAYYPIAVGSDVTIGAGAIIMPGVEIGDGAIVSAGAVVTKGSRVGPREVWGGVPAKKIGVR